MSSREILILRERRRASRHHASWLRGGLYTADHTLTLPDRIDGLVFDSLVNG